MARIYSTRFVDFSAPANTDYSFPFSDEFAVYVIRSIDVYTPPDPIGASFSLKTIHGATLIAVTYGPSAGQWEHWTGRQVAYPGDALIWSPITVNAIDPLSGGLVVSGYNLSS